MLGDAGSWNQRIEGAGAMEDWFEDKAQEEHAEATHGMTQMRGVEAEGADKYRVTLEVQQDVFGWFDIEREPIAEHGMPLLILIGAHARLSNIDENGRFIKDEAFEYAGTPVFRKAGTSARGLLRSWVKLRNTNPKAREWLEYIDVMQQPSGFQDSIISTWRIEREAFAILSAYKWSYRLSQVCAARLLQPQRLLTLTLDEEKKRVFEYWKDWEMRFGHLSWEKIIEGASSSNDLLECPGNFAAPD